MSGLKRDHSNESNIGHRAVYKCNQMFGRRWIPDDYYTDLRHRPHTIVSMSGSKKMQIRVDISANSEGMQEIHLPPPRYEDRVVQEMKTSLHQMKMQGGTTEDGSFKVKLLRNLLRRNK